MKDGGGETLKATVDEDGWYMIEYKHKGKPTTYRIQLYVDGLFITEDEIGLKGNAFVEWYFDEGIP